MEYFENTESKYLVEFINNNDLKSLQESLKFCENPNVFQLNNYGLIYYAINNENLEILKYLISIGCEFNYVYGKLTPFQYAFCHGHIKIAKYLYSIGVDIYFCSIPDNTTLTLAIYHGSLEVIKFLVSECNYNINEAKNELQNPLLVSMLRNKFDIFKYLIECGADIEATIENGINILMFILINFNHEYFKFLEYLVLMGINLNTPMQDCSILTFAVLKNNLELIKLLLNSGACFTENYSEISCAISYHYNEMAKYLINYTSCVYIPKKYSALDNAIEYKNIEILKFLLNQGVLMNNSIKYEHAILHACIKSSPEIVKLLIDYGCDVNYPYENLIKYTNNYIIDPFIYEFDTSTDSTINRFPLLYYASHLNLPDILELLLKNGADPNFETYHHTPIIPSIILNNLRSLKLLIKYGAELQPWKPIPYFIAWKFSNLQTLNYLLRCGCNMGFRYEETIPMVLSVTDRSPKILDFLIKNNYYSGHYGSSYCIIGPNDINKIRQLNKIFSDNGIGLYEGPDFSPLFYFVNNIDIINFYIQMGANIGALKNGKNIIHQIAKKGNITVLKRILDFGIDIYKIDSKGMTPYECACYYKNYTVASYIDNVINNEYNTNK